ncbi:DVU_1553 family AMP-dependent CoA ligase [Humidesulfovibrio sp.]
MKRSPLDAWLCARTGVPGPEPAALRAWQMAELRRTINWVRQASPCHARRLAELDTESLRSPADLALLPRMEATDLVAPGLLAVSQDEVERVVSLTTSGTTSRGVSPKRLSFTEADLARTLDFFAVGMSTLCGPGDVALVLLPGRRNWGVADLLARALPKIDALALPAPEDWTPETLPDILSRAAANVLVAAPAQLSRLLDLPTEAFRSLRSVLSSAEPLPDALRRKVEAAWGCEIFDHWGMTETGYGGGVECAAHSGYHLREVDLLLEIAYPATGEPLRQGETGEILVTTLGRRALPLVRYRTGDAAAWIPGPCPCGSALSRLGRVPGRIAPDGSISQPGKGGRTA